MPRRTVCVRKLVLELFSRFGRRIKPYIEVALDEKVQVKVFVVTLERRFDLLGNLQQANVAR